MATFSVTPSSLAFVTAAFTIFCASSEEMLCFFTTSAIGHRPSMVRAVLPSSSRVQKQSRVCNEELRVHVVRAVIGVGVDDQLRIRDVLLHDEREHGGYVHVVTAIHDECWLPDRLQIVGGPLLLDAPLANRFDLGGRHLVVHFGIAALLPTTRALQELPSRRLARRGRTEFDREPDIIGRIVGIGTKEPPRSLGDQLHSLTAARTCAIDDQPANEIGRLHSDFLHDHAADREAKQVNLLQPQRLDEGDGVSAHLLERRRDLAGAAGDARVVEQDHLPVASQAIRHRWIPIIHGAEVVLVKDERDAVGFAKAAIAEADSAGFDKLGRCRLGCLVMHRSPPVVNQLAFLHPRGWTRRSCATRVAKSEDDPPGSSETCASPSASQTSAYEKGAERFLRDSARFCQLLLRIWRWLDQDLSTRRRPDSTPAESY